MYDLSSHFHHNHPLIKLSHDFCSFHRWIHFGSSDVVSSRHRCCCCCSSFCYCLPLPFVSFCCVVYASCVVSFLLFLLLFLPCHLMCSISCDMYIAFATFTSSWNMTHIDVRPYFHTFPKKTPIQLIILSIFIYYIFVFFFFFFLFSVFFFIFFLLLLLPLFFFTSSVFHCLLSISFVSFVYFLIFAK